MERIRELAQRYALMMTGGSDYHGSYWKMVEPGQYLCPAETVEYLMNHKT